MSPEQLKKILPNCKNPVAWAEALSKQLPAAAIVSPAQISRFVAQTAHESMEYNTLEESLNYSGDRLMVIFPKYFRGLDVSPYHRKPERIANVVYASRMGNGNIDSGDGYKFRGRGILQLTGRNNYTACSEAMFGDDRLLDDPDMLLKEEHALGSAIWFWNVNGLNDITDFTKLTKRINGGTIGLDHRTALYNKAIAVLS
jgi:putative chitinase